MSQINPQDFTRPPLREGHAAASAADWTDGIPDRPVPIGRADAAARTGPAGPRGEPGSGTADRDMAGGDLQGWGGTGDQVDPDFGDGDVGVLKGGMVPSRFHRPYLSGGHQAQSPAVTGRQSVVPAPQMDEMPGNPAHVNEPADFDRGYLTAGHADPSPANMAQVSPHYTAAAAQYEANRAKERSQHLLPSTCITTPEPSSHGPLQMPADMRASEVPHTVVVQASRAAPGERR
jgi:hypothetical protein